MRDLLAQWYLRLLLSKMTLEYKPEASNTATDSLSRAPLLATGQAGVLLHNYHNQVWNWSKRQ